MKLKDLIAFADQMKKENINLNTRVLVDTEAAAYSAHMVESSGIVYEDLEEEIGTAPFICLGLDNYNCVIRDWVAK